MSAIGERNEIINATQVFLKLGGDTYILMQELDLLIERDETREDVATGAIYFYSQHRNAFEATIFLSAPEIVDYLDLISFGANDFLPVNSYQIQYVPNTGVSRTVNATAMAPYVAFQKAGSGGVTARIRFRINEDISGGDVT